MMEGNVVPVKNNLYVGGSRLKCALGLLARSSRLGLFDSGLVGLGHSVDHTGESANGDGRDVAKVGWVAKEEQAGRSDGEPWRQSRAIADQGRLTCSVRRPSSTWSTRKS